MLHSAGSGFVNKNVDKNKGVVNGLYVSFYYFGGILGSYLPGLIYENEGWKIFLIFLTAISVSIFLLFTIGFKKAF
jgi:YNFM family putative membrane transporter